MEVVDPIHNRKRMSVYDPVIDTVALLFSRVRGRQTVPRAELWALYKILLLQLAPDKVDTIYCAAQYVLNGLSARSRHYSVGSNGDSLLDRRIDGDVTFLKVKSHVETPDDFIKHNLIEEGLILNALADCCGYALWPPADRCSGGQG